MKDLYWDSGLHYNLTTRRAAASSQRLRLNATDAAGQLDVPVSTKYML